MYQQVPQLMMLGYEWNYGIEQIYCSLFGELKGRGDTLITIASLIADRAMRPVFQKAQLNGS